jgi:hypothetical protein
MGFFFQHTLKERLTDVATYHQYLDTKTLNVRWTVRATLSWYKKF